MKRLQHIQKQHQHIKQFVRLEQEREKAIDDAVDKCRRNEAFSTDLINQITVQMNELAKRHRSHKTARLEGNGCRIRQPKISAGLAGGSFRVWRHVFCKT